MIKIINRSMSIPIPDRVIGHVGDNLVETRSFELNRYYGEVDLSEFSFKLDTEINGTKNIIDLDKSVTEDKITLIWTVHASHVLHAGRMTIQLRAFHDDVEKWHSAQDYVIIQDSTNAPDAYSSLLPSEFEQMELRVTTLKEQAEASAQTATEQANRAQGIADEFENETLPAAIAAVEAAVDEQVDIAASHADRAQGIADTFENTTLPAAIQSVEQAVEEQIGIAKGHADRAQELADTFEQTTLPAAISAVEAAGQAKVDLAEQQADRVEDIIQEAEQDVLPELRQAIEDGIETKGQLDGSIQEAGEARTALDGSISSAGTAKGELDGSISSAGVAKTQLDGSISSANGIKSQLDGSITAAGQAKELLDESIATGDIAAFRAEFESHKNEYATYKDSNSLKVAKIEKDLNDYKQTMAGVNVNQEATQQATGYGIIPLPKNAANGQFSDVSLKGLTATQLTQNGDFVNGTTGWLVFGGESFTVVNGIAEYVANAQYGRLTHHGNRFKTVIGNRVYRYGLVKSNSNQVGLTGGSTGVALHSGSGNFERLSFIRTATGNDEYSGVSDNRTSDWDKIYIDSISSIDLTATFGAGNEPTKEQCDAMFPNYFDGTKSTVSAMRLKSVGKNLFSSELEMGSISLETGLNTPSSEVKRSAEFTTVTPNTQYTISRDVAHGSFYIHEYDSDNVQVKYSSTYALSLTFTTSVNTVSIKVRTVNAVSTIQLELGATATSYEPYTESNMYLPNVGELRSLPNGTKDEIRVSENKLIKRIGDKTNVASGTVIDFADMAVGGTYYAWNEDGETEAGIKGDTLGIDATILTYQLTTPIEKPIHVSGSLVSYPSGTVYIEPFVADAGIYTDKMEVLYSDLPIKALEKLSKIDFMTGIETELDVSETVIAGDKLSFTHPDLEAGDIAFFVYEYDRESTVGETEIEYYDSRYVVKDDVTGKFYKWNVKVSNGTPTIEIVEV